MATSSKIASSPGPSPKKMRSEYEDYLTDSLKDIDIELKAACYDISNQQTNAALQTVERVRRKLKVIEGKSHFYFKNAQQEKRESNQKIHSLQSREKYLLNENRMLRNRMSECKDQVDSIFSENWEEDSTNVDIKEHAVEIPTETVEEKFPKETADDRFPKETADNEFPKESTDDKLE